MAGDQKEPIPTELAEPVDFDPLAPLTNRLGGGLDKILGALLGVGEEILRLDAGAAPIIQSQHVRFRVRAIIVNPVTASTMTLTIGTATYPFDGAARGLAWVPFPLVIERGSDISCAGTDGRLYLIGDPE